ncbi:FAD-dependent monooxygenase [Catenulispora rubra]|uniref:FAD-dependent monooxygenase n=1 Tax=Catenulispora rubra TaxID=280293 RepID=UPI002B2753CB|nr:FAD-dependent monooxygenase [Catenulispora rubra]
MGAGIGGLAAALSLHDAGLGDVRVAEAAPALGPRPVGGGVCLLPDAVRELTELGLGDAVDGCGVATEELAYYDLSGGTRVWAEPRGLAAGYRWPQYSVHRGELQMALYNAVLARMGTDVVRTGARLTGYVQIPGGAVEALFADAYGGTHSEWADLLVGADGVHSMVRAQMNPAEGAPICNGKVMWRGTTLAEPFLTGRSMIMAGDGARKFVCHALSAPDPRTGKALTNWVAEAPLAEHAVSELPVSAIGDWTREADRAEVLGHFTLHGRHASRDFGWLDIRGLIEDSIAVYECPPIDRDPLAGWTHGRVTLLGDAAHPMHPIASNGASQAILDARVLAHALGTVHSIDDALAQYEALRRPATAALQLTSMAASGEIAVAGEHAAGVDPRALDERGSYGVRGSVAR